MRRIYTAWSDTEGGDITGLSRGEDRPTTADGEPLPGHVFPVWRLEAGSHEEAMAVYNIRRGFGPYKPLGEPAPCPACGAPYYPEGSAQCWNCDHEG
ncbi:hypothetical protein ACG04R_03440 [Roseateles sp. BYS78W]|uniref:Uncharacterized protein n=1 Tax=Pelomonas candidula TaxID=3299025 RepID=A0ABW7H7A8_9BURK